MNEETTLPSVEATDGSMTEATIYEDFSGAAIEETTAEVVITLEEVQSIGSDILHADLFGSFLICGTLIGLALLRDRHGN